MKHGARCAATLAATLLGACGAKDRGAVQAYERGDYAEAAERYDALLAQQPNDASLRQRRDEARRRAHAQQLAGIAAVAPHDLDRKIAELRTLLTRRDSWTPGTPSLGDAQLDGALASVEDDVRMHLTAELRGFTQARRMLAGGDALAARRQALPFADFGELWPVLVEEGRAATAQHCRAVMPARPADSPHLTSLLTAYCNDAGAPVPPPSSLGLASELGLSVSIAGVSAAQAAAASHVVSMSFIESPWYDPASPLHLTGTLTGRNDFWFTARAEMLEAPWSEQVAYEDTETFQEPYTDTETYSEQVPYTVDHTESYPCGSSTCTRQVPSTEYRTESRTRTVTKYRTATRTVTRFRTEQRSHTYRATRRDGKYAASWQVAVQLDAISGELPLAFPVTAGITQYGYDHDESFAPAELAPGRANLMTPEGWFDYVVSGLGDRLRDQLRLRWQASFCRLPSYTVETAARCARGVAPPALAHVALEQIFGADTDLALQRFTPWGVRQLPPQPAAAP